MAAVTTVGADPARVDIDIYAGEEVDFTVSYLDAAGEVQDFTGWTLSAQVRAAHDTAVLYTFTPEAVSGGIQVTADGSDTADWANWPTSVARWSLWGTPSGGSPTPLVAAWVRVRTTVHQ